MDEKPNLNSAQPHILEADFVASNYAHVTHNTLWGMTKKEPEISISTLTSLDPDDLDTKRFQNACIYVTYKDLQNCHWLLANLNKPRPSDIEADKTILTPGGRRDYDHGLFYTALRELKEEANLYPENILKVSPEAMVAYVTFHNFSAKRNGLSAENQIHIYHIHLGQLSDRKIRYLNASVHAGSDVAIAQFVNIQPMLMGCTPIISLRDADGKDKTLPFAGIIISTCRKLFIHSIGCFDYYRFQDIYNELTVPVDQKIYAKITKTCAYKIANDKGMLGFLKLLLISLKITDLPKVIASLNPQLQALFMAWIEKYAVFTIKNLKDAVNTYKSSQNILDWAQSTDETQATLSLLKKETCDKKRFIIAQNYIITEPNRNFSRALREILLFSIKHHPDFAPVLLMEQQKIDHFKLQNDLNVELLGSVKNNNIEIVTNLLNRQANILFQDDNGFSVLHLVSSVEMFELLIKHGAATELKLHYVTQEGHDHWGFTPLHWHALNGSFNMVEMLLAYGAVVDAKSAHEVTPLFLATKIATKMRQPNYPIIELLTRYGANIRSRNIKDGSPANFAMGCPLGHERIGDRFNDLALFTEDLLGRQASYGARAWFGQQKNETLLCQLTQKQHSLHDEIEDLIRNQNFINQEIIDLKATLDVQNELMLTAKKSDKRKHPMEEDAAKLSVNSTFWTRPENNVKTETSIEKDLKNEGGF